MLAHLREMRAQLQGITTQLLGISAKLEEHDRRFDDFHLLANHALGLGTMNQMKARELEARHDLMESWQRRAEERFNDSERRLSKVEKTDT